MRSLSVILGLTAVVGLSACGDDSTSVNANNTNANDTACGNGVAEIDEMCDGADLHGQTCESLGHDSGTLACTNECTWDTSGCEGSPSCGDGTVDQGEECDDGINNSDTEPDACRTSCIAAWCGDLVVDSQEDCEWNNLGGNGCTDLGFAGGVLLCATDCTFDTTNCSSCGNQIAEAGEDCDGADLAGTSCADLGFDAGQLACDNSCGFDTENCRQCGNGVAEPAEVCDGNDLAGQTCQTAAGHTDGDLTCSADCQALVTDDCYTCGNGTIEGSETCDGANHGGATCWTAAGHASGSLTCVDCALDVSDCYTCGNNSIEGPEVCDIGTFGGATCASITGYTDGSLDCDAGCLGIDSSGCHTCGNNSVEGTEQCDQSDLDGANCQSTAGLASGTLGCSASCAFDTTGCFECGNGTIDGPELCDGNVFGALSCMSEAGHADGLLTCQPGCFAVDTSGCHTCGNSQIEGPEDCDNFNPGSDTCTSLGHDGGWIACGSDCFYDETGCWDCGNGTCEYDKGETWQNCVQDCGWVGISGGNGRTCATKSDGSLWCWGKNTSGHELGDCSSSHGLCPGSGNPDCAIAPVRVPDASNVNQVAISAGHACFINFSQQTWCWGANSFGQIGDGTTGPACPPVQVVGLPTSSSVSAGFYHTCAVTGFETVGCWGRNTPGVFGDGTTVDSLTPVPAINLPAVLEVSANKMNGFHTCAAAVDGTAWCWGQNGYGQLGDGSAVASTVPVQVVEPSDPSGFLQGVISIAVGEQFSCVRKENGTVWCWGLDGNAGRLGDGLPHSDCGATDCSYTPVQAAGITTATDLACGLSNACVIASGGEVWCWGYNIRGAIGDGSNTDRDTPTQTVGITTAVDIAVGGGPSAHSCAVLADGSAWCWGDNTSGQLGANLTNWGMTIPQQVVGP